MKIGSPRDLAAAVRGRRASLGLSQADLAKRAGVSRPWLSNVEAGKPTAEFGRIIRLLDALGLSLHLDIASMDLTGAETATIDLDALLSEYENHG
jgi:HTH-type transcriptional regulator/antitoxin HipB